MLSNAVGNVKAKGILGDYKVMKVEVARLEARSLH
jgi:hypothetical protein